MKEMEIKLLHSLLESLASELPHGNPPDQMGVRARELAHELGYFVHDPDDLANLEKITEERREKSSGA